MDPNVRIAVIGMSCRFPGDVRNPEDLWQLCAAGRTGWSEIPSSRFNSESTYHPNAEKINTTNVVGGHFLEEDPSLFDAGFFNLSSEAASSMDPQFRLQLESTYEALESAGIPIEKVAGSDTSVFAGAFFRDYSDAQLRDPDTLPRFTLLGVGTAMASNRISHFYDLRGASMTVDTGCSTTLTALHQACQSLRTGESDMSIVGGANVILNPDNFLIMSSLSLLGGGGRSYAFDSRAEGYGRGEGSATVILKRLDDAIRDGDPIRAVIRASGVNQDGKTETVTTPSQAAQEKLISSCYRRAGLDPLQTAYFEAHGTGTRTGDPIEARAIASIFKEGRSKEKALRVGSVKTNVGHTETTSGLASIIKVTLALERGQIPPSANFKEPNENIHLDEWNLKVPTKLEAWPGDAHVRQASINNFGYGGANAHVIMEAYQSANTGSSVGTSYSNGLTNGHNDVNGVHEMTNGTNGLNGVNRINEANGIKGANGVNRVNGVHDITNGTNGVNGVNGVHRVNGHPKSKQSRIIVLSGKDEQSTEAMVSNLKEYLLEKKVEDEEKFFTNLTYTMSQRRSRFNWVAAQSAYDVSDLIKSIESGKMKASRKMELAPRLGYVFTGQGAQWFAMGRELINAYPVFKDCLLECEAVLKKLGAPWSLIEELTRDEKTSRVNDVALSTPLCVAVQIALSKLLRSWGIVPTAMTSHSSGEIASACALGALSLDATMASVLFRGELASGITDNVSGKGGMMAVGLGPEATQKYIGHVTSGELVAACLNSPSSTTVSGDVPAIEELEKILKADGVFARRLVVDAAWHSHHVQAIAKPYHSLLSNHLSGDDSELAQAACSSVLYSSPTTGKRMASVRELCEPEHWVKSLTNPVRFTESFRNMCFDDNEGKEAAIDIVVEVGPHAALSGPINDIKTTLPEFQGSDISYVSCLVRKNNAVSTMQAMAIELLRKGYPVDMAAVNFPSSGGSGFDVVVDLPSYPWNHSTSHWSESRFNKALRQRREPPHDLLGSLALGCNQSTPAWRHVISIADVPWLADHVVQSNIVYPGAGYLCMAIEGASAQFRSQHQDDSTTTIRGYELRDVDILQALVVPEDANGVEIQLSLRSCNPKDISATGWQEFQICSVSNDNTWADICKGLVRVEIQQERGQQCKSPITRQSNYRTRIDPKDIYAGLRAAGIYHGPIFQNLTNIRGREKHSVSTFRVADTASTMPHRYQLNHVLHPTTLDTVFQAAYTALPGAGSKPVAQIPKSIKRFWVDHDIISTPGHCFNAYTTLSRCTAQSFGADISVIDDGSHDASPVLAVEGFVCQSIGNGPHQSLNSLENEKFVKTQWAPDISFLKPAFLKQQLSYPLHKIETETLLDMRRLCVYFIRDSLTFLTATDVQQLDPHHKRFYSWMKLQVKLDMHAVNMQPNPATQDEKEALIAKASAASVNGQMISRLGPKLTAILRREVTPLEIMLEDGFLNHYYEKLLKLDRSTQQVAEFVKHFVHKNPRAKILEIGAGTGGATTSVLTALGVDDCDGGPLAHSYDFTDLSSGFFEVAKGKFEAWKDLVRYKKLDIEQDPLKQGFEEGSYDLVVACQVLHATKSMTNTMDNVRKLMKPGGKLLLIETTKDQLDVQFAFGLLPGWWLSEEEERKLSPSLSIDMWDRTLLQTGFNGVETELHDCESEDFYSFSVIVSTASDSSTFDSPVALVSATPLPDSWTEAFQNAFFQVTNVLPTVELLESVTGDNNKIYIFIEIDHPILKDPNSEQFESIRALCTKSKGLLWVSRGGAIDCENLDLSLQVGFLRSLRMEYGGKRLATLDLDPKQELWSLRSIPSITQTFKSIFFDSTEGISSDFEFADRNETILIPRYHKDVKRNRETFPDSDDASVPKMEPIHQPNRPLRLFVGTPGLLDTLAWNDDPSALQELDLDTVEVEPRAFGLNFRDVMVSMGQLNSELMGFECAGFVTRVGRSAAEQGFKSGDRVAMLLRGFYGNLTKAHWTSVAKIPANMSFEIAASLPVSFCTAYLSLYNTAMLRKGETILIHAATGAFGQAAVILAKHLGAEIFVTVGTEAKRDFVIKTYGIAPDHIFNSRDISFAAGILAATQGRGVDVVLNSLAGQLLQESFNCVAPFGRFLEIGKRDLEQNSHLAMGSFTRSISFTSIDLLTFSEFKPYEINEVFKNVIRLYEEGVIVPVDPITVYSVTEIEKTFRLMQAGKHMGKIVITMAPDDLVPVLPQTPTARLRSDCSYLVVGGLGGIGRSVCHWMASRGARNIIVVSRSLNPEKAAPFVADMEKVGCRVKVAGCDISDEAQVANVLRTCAREIPQIRGVIQAAMVLQDSILERMTLDDYRAGIRPKVLGTWNLHQQLADQELDFFVMLSSLVGIAGYASQSSYSAGGAFQDALARYRIARGLPAVSIDLGQVKSVGYVAETDGTAERLLKQGIGLLSEDEVLKTIESAIISPFSAQLMVGLNTGPGSHWEEATMARDSRFSPLRYREPAQNTANTVKAGPDDLGGKIAASSTMDQAVEVVVEALIKKLSDIFMIGAETVDASKSLSSYGVDSLVAVELRNMLALRAGAEVSIFDIMQSRSITALAATVATKSRHIDPSLVNV